MNRYLLAALPMALSTIRLFAGPIYLLVGAVTPSPKQTLLLIVVVLTDVIDGRIARYLGVTSGIGGALDTTSDKVFVLAILLKLMIGHRIPSALFYVMLGQFLVLAVEGSIYVWRFNMVPIPDLAARVSAVFAFTTALVGVTVINQRAVIVLGVLTIVSNCVHIVTAFVRISADHAT